MPFKSKKQEQYLRLNEPEVYRDWKNKYGSYKEAESFNAESPFYFTGNQRNDFDIVQRFKKHDKVMANITLGNALQAHYWRGQEADYHRDSKRRVWYATIYPHGRRKVKKVGFDTKKDALEWVFWVLNLDMENRIDDVSNPTPLPNPHRHLRRGPQTNESDSEFWRQKGWNAETFNADAILNEEGYTASGHKVDWDDGGFYMEFENPIDGYESVDGVWYGGGDGSPDVFSVTIEGNDENGSISIDIDEVEYYGDVTQYAGARWRIIGNVAYLENDDLLDAVEEGLNWMIGDFEEQTVVERQYRTESFNAESGDMERYMNMAWKKYTPREKMDMQLMDLHYGHSNKNTKRYFKKGYEYGWKLAREKAANGAPLYRVARAKDLITTSLRKDGFLVDAGAYAGFDDSWRVYEGELNAESFNAETVSKPIYLLYDNYKWGQDNWCYMGTEDFLKAEQFESYYYTFIDGEDESPDVYDNMSIEEMVNKMNTFLNYDEGEGVKLLRLEFGEYGYAWPSSEHFTKTLVEGIIEGKKWDGSGATMDAMLGKAHYVHAILNDAETFNADSEATATMKSALYSLTAVGVGVYIFKNFVMGRLPQRGEK